MASDRADIESFAASNQCPYANVINKGQEWQREANIQRAMGIRGNTRVALTELQTGLSLVGSASIIEEALSSKTKEMLANQVNTSLDRGRLVVSGAERLVDLFSQDRAMAPEDASRIAQDLRLDQGSVIAGAESQQTLIDLEKGFFASLTEQEQRTVKFLNEKFTFVNKEASLSSISSENRYKEVMGLIEEFKAMVVRTYQRVKDSKLQQYIVSFGEKVCGLISLVRFKRKAIESKPSIVQYPVVAPQPEIALEPSVEIAPEEQMAPELVARPLPKVDLLPKEMVIEEPQRSSLSRRVIGFVQEQMKGRAKFQAMIRAEMDDLRKRYPYLSSRRLNPMAVERARAQETINRYQSDESLRQQAKAEFEAPIGDPVVEETTAPSVANKPRGLHRLAKMVKAGVTSFLSVGR